jgi:hypothetical protein
MRRKMTTSVRRAALDSWLTRASELIEEQSSVGCGDERPSATRYAKFGRLRGSRWDGESAAELVAGIWGSCDESSEDVVA